MCANTSLISVSKITLLIYTIIDEFVNLLSAYNTGHTIWEWYDTHKCHGAGVSMNFICPKPRCRSEKSSDEAEKTVTYIPNMSVCGCNQIDKLNKQIIPFCLQSVISG